MWCGGRQFQDILKPNYNSVDFAEVELTDNEAGPRANNSDLLAGHQHIIEAHRYLTPSPSPQAGVKNHLKPSATSWLSALYTDEIMDHFASGNWTLHPDWVYCEYKYDQNRVFQSPEDLMKDFLSRAQKPHWKWRSTRTRPPPEPTMNQAQSTRDPEDVLVTATRAIFIEENTYRRAPAAVVGVTIKHSKFCPSYPSRDSSCKTAKTCESTSLDCYLLDDNGFIIASEREEDTGKFFGTLEGTIIESFP
ncbi:Voltage-dependent calcium channel subunit alpha-2/delta-4-like [Homarus americanus]|uniref:Voltage-dependent calcium channel subunit alpha-2/delta-4-like n=1 Tax=Homarus americanus TaxID=6706 RepID=A0A8J5MZ52_HOMAM|nr:Voltage-dependent calcium channel subunit alpha-2/delta-4-like [Homarus americanus]